MNSASAGNIEAIYNILLTGSRIILPFDTAQQATNFRISLARYKARNDKLLQGLGLELPENEMTLSFRKPKTVESGEITFEVFLKEKSIQKQFSFKIVDAPVEGSEQQESVETCSE